jgi:hypothetical protein
MSGEEQREFDRGLWTNGREALDVRGTMADGTRYVWDSDLGATVEVSPDGRKYRVELRGSKLVRAGRVADKRGWFGWIATEIARAAHALSIGARIK